MMLHETRPFWGRFEGGTGQMIFDYDVALRCTRNVQATGCRTGETLYEGGLGGG
jgi:hypothetical protein